MVILCDVDGCVADVRELVSKYLPDWGEYFKHQSECMPIPSGVNLARSLACGSTLIFMTGRLESVRSETERWLSASVTFRHRGLLMRPVDFRGSTQELKASWFSEYKPDLIIDDDPSVIELAVQAGFAVLQMHGYRWSGTRDYFPGEAVPRRSGDGRFSFVRNAAGTQSPEKTLRILMYELGKVIEYQLKAEVYGETGYYSVESQKKEMSDLISMARYYCEQRGWDFQGLMQLGENGYMDRMQDIRKYGVGGKA